MVSPFCEVPNISSAKHKNCRPKVPIQLQPIPSFDFCNQKLLILEVYMHKSVNFHIWRTFCHVISSHINFSCL